MFLESTIKYNPNLIKTAFELHKNQAIGPNTYVIDLDAVSLNTFYIVQEAKKFELKLYLMTKQYGRNPLVTWAAAQSGLDKIVAVDIDEAKKLAAHGFKLGHVGHLVQIPSYDLKRILSTKPELVTVFSVEKARQISDACKELGINQDILIRVFDRNDFFYPGQFGGINIELLEDSYKEIEKLQNIRVVGVTSHPCLIYDYEKGCVEETPNFRTLLKAAEILNKLGAPIKEINTPSVTTTSTIGMLKEKGSTIGEPGSSITGNTPIHAYYKQPEIPAMVYVSEISHLSNGYGYFFGGGIYSRSRMKYVLVGRDYQTLNEQVTSVITHPCENIDYYGALEKGNFEIRVGDTVIAAFRTQVFVTRSRVAVVSGIQKGNPKLLGIFDQHGNLLDNNGLPYGIEKEKNLLKLMKETITARKQNMI